MRTLLLFIVVACLLCPMNVQVHADTRHMSVHFLHVGQADCIFVQTSAGKNVLIDSGNNTHQKKVIAYLKKRDVETIDILIATHPHHDHIGGMDGLIETFTVNALYLPPLSHGTRTYKKLKEAVANENITVFQAKTGQTIRLADDIRMDVLAPLGKRYEQMNDHSLVLKLTHGKNRFLFTGDAGIKSEREMLEKHLDVKADVLKVGHHGANTSTSDAFLKAVDPQYAVITTGGTNDDTFPSDKIIGRLKQQQVTTFRTDQLGTVIAVSNGDALAFFQHG